MELDEASIGTSRTRWSVVRSATEGNESERLAALEYLLRRYSPVLRSFVSKRFRLNPNDTEDLVQDFLIDRVLHRSLLANASAERGRFRSFLKRSITGYTVDVLRKKSALKRSPSEQAESLDVMIEEGLEMPESQEDNLFNEAFARQIIGDAIRRMERHCQNIDRRDLFSIFEGRILKPALEGCEPVDYTNLCSEQGLASAIEAQNLLASAKRIFRREFRAVVEEYSESAALVDEELAALGKFLE